MKKIAIIEDQLEIRENYTDMLISQGYAVTGFAERESAQIALLNDLPDLAIIDIGLGDEIDGGFTLCQALRAKSPTLPIIFLTARDNEIDTVSGLHMGADDYLTKDISLAHLAARISAIFRRQLALNAPQQQEQLIERGPLVIDPARMQVTWHNHTIDLTVTEYWLVHALAIRPGHVKHRNDLMTEAKIYVDDSTITSHIKRIRKKFLKVDSEFNQIDTVYGMGYRWEAK